MKVSDVDRAGAFWSEALAFDRHLQNPAFLLPGMRPPEPVSILTMKTGCTFDLWAVDEDDQKAQVERLISLGAQRVEWDYPDDGDFVVLADPDGDLFCVIA